MRISCSSAAGNILAKNVMDIGAAGIGYFAIGWALAFGPGGNAFAGASQFFLADLAPTSFPDFLFGFAFACTATTIVSGSVAERMKFKVYLVYALVISSVIYSVPSHWVWDSSGWLYKMGMHDLAGCSAIHSVGGVCGLLSTIWLGPRLGTFTQDEKGNNVYWPTRSSPTQVCYGTFLLWSGW